MTKRIIVLLAVFILAFAGAAEAKKKHRRYRSPQEKDPPPLVLSSPPKRIVSLAPNVTEILYAVGLGERVVAVTDGCNWPAEAKDKPKVGGMKSPSIEAVLRAKPDVVVMTTDGNTKEFQQKLGKKIKTYVFRTRRLAELPSGIRELGKALAVSKEAEKAAVRVEADLKGFSERAAARKKAAPEKSLFIVWPEPLIAAGPDTAINDALRLLGLDNIASSSITPYPKFDIEQILLNEPDIIFIARGHDDVEKFAERLLKKISSTPAAKNKRVYYVDETILRLGPRTAEGIAEMEGRIDEAAGAAKPAAAAPPSAPQPAAQAPASSQ